MKTLWLLRARNSNKYSLMAAPMALTDNKTSSQTAGQDDISYGGKA